MKNKYLFISDCHIGKSNFVLQTMKRLFDKGIPIKIVADIYGIELPRRETSFQKLVKKILRKRWKKLN